MKVLHCYKDYYPPVIGGIECHIHALARGTRPRVEADVLVSNRRFRTEIVFEDGIRVIKAADLGRVSSAALTPGYPAWLKGVDCDLLHFHTPNPTSELSYLLTKPDRPVVVTYHSDIVRQKAALRYYAPFLRRFLKAANRIIVTSPNYLDSSPFLQDIREKCVIVPLGIDVTPFANTPDVRQQADALAGEHGQPLLLFCGALRYYKGFRYLAEAMQRIDATLLVIGAGPHLPEEQRRVKDLGVADKVVFLGEKPHEELAPYYYAADLLVLPSIYRSEAFGLVQLEAHACGTPVISTNIASGVPFANEHGRTGLTVEPASPAALAEAVNELLADSNRRAEMGAYARERCLRDFTVEKMCERVLEVYGELCPD